jgi:HAD superfamily hydrolase (TIGR01484 family)
LSTQLSSRVSAEEEVMVPKLWRDAAPDDLYEVRGVCLDIDDTLSTSGKLTPDAYAALWTLKEAGFGVVPVTGRPAGWCDHIARFWPVDAVIGENGAFTFFVEKGVRKRTDTLAGVADVGALQLKLRELGEKIRARFPEAKWASDQAYREYDLAIDICEDVPAWPEEDVKALLELCHGEGAHAKLSSIHVNAWFGDYDKGKGFEHWLKLGAPGLNPGPKGKVPSLSQWLFVGDSPNDEPMYQKFEYSVGVANLRKYVDQLVYPPNWITSEESGKGFAQVVRKLLLANNRRRF